MFQLLTLKVSGFLLTKNTIYTKHIFIFTLKNKIEHVLRVFLGMPKKGFEK
jgi:hypothetical protein